VVAVVERAVVDIAVKAEAPVKVVKEHGMSKFTAKEASKVTALPVR